MTPEALRRRMAHGNIYAADKVDAALAHYFRVGNLAALRELALLWVADRVDEGAGGVPGASRHHRAVGDPRAGRRRADRRARRRSADPPWRPHGRSQPRRARRVSTCATSTGSPAPDDGLLDRHRVLLDELGGRYAEVTGADAADALVRFALAENATQLVLGASRRSRWAELTKGSVINQRDPPVRADRRPRHLHRRRRSRRRRSVAGAGRRQPVRAIGPAAGHRLGGRGRRHPPCRPRAASRSRTRWACPASCSLLLLAPVAVALLGGLRPALAASLRRLRVRRLVLHRPRRTVSGSRTPATPWPSSCSWRSRRWSAASSTASRGAARSWREARPRSEALAELASGTALLDDRGAAPARDRAAPHPRLRRGGGARSDASTAGGSMPPRASGVPRSPEDGSYAAELAGGSMLVVAGPSLAAEDRRLLSAFVAQLRARAGHAAAAGRGDLGGGPGRGEQRARRAARRRVPRPARAAGQHQGCRHQPAQRRRRLAGRRRSVRSPRRSTPKPTGSTRLVTQPPRHGSPPGRDARRAHRARCRSTRWCMRRWPALRSTSPRSTSRFLTTCRWCPPIRPCWSGRSRT